MSKEGWIGVDFDGTLAVYDGWHGPLEFGRPITPMVEYVKQLIADGWEVRIFTARVAEPEIDDAYLERVRAAAAHSGEVDMSSFDARTHAEEWHAMTVEIRTAIEDWCELYIGQRLRVTNVKDFGMVMLYDDRAVRVEPNTGIRCCDQRRQG